MTVSDIINKANSFVDSSKYVYWYGGKNNKCTEQLLNTLKQLYPKVYTPAYIAACKLDIQQNKYCIDCSGLVCVSYDKPQVGTSQFDKYFTEYKGSHIRDGMIVWRANHCGIYYNNKIIEARGRWVGITNTRPYTSKYWSKVYYDPNVTYSSVKNQQSKVNLLDVAKDVIAGKYGNGADRKKALTDAGYDYDMVQKLVNSILSSK